MDRAILAGWRQMNRKLCPKCGRPLAVHDDDDVDDYHVSFFTCTATQALDAEQAVIAKEDEPERKRGLDPDRARIWVTHTDEEGPPVA